MVCVPHKLPMLQLYISPRQCVYRCLGSLCRHKQNTTWTSVWSCSYTEALDGTVSWEVEPYILLSLPYRSSQGDNLHPHKLTCEIQGTCRTYKWRGTDWQRPHNGILPPALLCSMFSWPRIYPRTRHLEYILENALHRNFEQSSFWRPGLSHKCFLNSHHQIETTV